MKKFHIPLILLSLTALTGCASNAADSQDKPELTLGCFGESDSLQDAVAWYNQNSSCTITVIDYWEEDITAAVNAMYQDILEGNGPDIIQFESQNVNDKTLAAHGMLEDLTLYLEESIVVQASDFVPSLYETLRIDGHLYMVPTNFGIETILTKEKWAAGTANWTAGECLESLTSAAAERPELDYGMDRNELHNYMKIYGLNSENDAVLSGKENAYIRIANYLPEQRIYSPDEKIRMEGGMFWESVLLSDAEGFLYHKSAWGEDSKYTGFPGAKGNGIAFLPINSYGINADCKYKEEAWQFIESFFSDAWQESITPNWNFSVCQKTLEKQLRQVMKTDYYKDNQGNRQERPLLSYEMTDGTIVDVFPAKQEDIEELKSMIDNAVLLHRQDPEEASGHGV